MIERPFANGKNGNKQVQPDRTNWVLVVDDDKNMGAETRSALEEAGYRVYLAENCEEAVECCQVAQESGYPFDSVIFGRNVQGGKETIGKMLEIDPDAKIIVRKDNFDEPAATDIGI